MMPLFRNVTFYLDGKESHESYADWLRRNLTHNIAAFALRNLPTDILELRAGFEKFAGKSAAYLKSRHPRLTIEPFPGDGVYAEKISTSSCNDQSPVVLWSHGGGYVFGSVNAYREVAVRFSYRLGCRVILYDYRTAPESPFPAALDDADKMFDAVEARFGKQGFYLLGDSAGGGLSAALMLKRRDDGKSLPKGAILMSPWADLTAVGPSVQSNSKYDIMLRPERLPFLARLYATENVLRDPYVSPIFGRFEGLPRLLIFVGGRELLRDDGVRVYEAAKRAGVDVQLKSYRNMQHVWPIVFKHLPETKKAMTEMMEFLQS